MEIARLLNELISARTHLSPHTLPTHNIPDGPGVYAFWYRNANPPARDLNRAYQIQGKQKAHEKKEPAYIMHHVEWNWNLDQEYICVYIGKTSCLSNRIKQHLYVKIEENIYTYDAHKIPSGNKRLLYKPTTSCQFRSGFDWLFKGRDKMRAQALQHNIFFSVVEVTSMITRFYLEDYYIGILRPWFNLDSER